MKIIFARGQTCNQFWVYTNFIAEALEHKEKIAIWKPDISIVNYPNLTSSAFIYFPLFSATLARLIGYKRYITIIEFLFCNKYSISFFKLFFSAFSKHSFIITDVLTEKSFHRAKHLGTIRKLFLPATGIVDEVNLFLKTAKSQNEILIGVHIRYGDYRYFENGRYFYTLAQYKKILARVEKEFEGKQLVFFIASSEKINLKELHPFRFISLQNATAAKDLYCLSQADYLVGPPSTFSAWASLMGNKPIYFIEDIDKNIQRDDFVLIQDKWF